MFKKITKIFLHCFAFFLLLMVCKNHKKICCFVLFVLYLFFGSFQFLLSFAFSFSSVLCFLFASCISREKQKLQKDFSFLLHFICILSFGKTENYKKICLVLLFISAGLMKKNPKIFPCLICIVILPCRVELRVHGHVCTFILSFGNYSLGASKQ